MTDCDGIGKADLVVYATAVRIRVNDVGFAIFNHFRAADENNALIYDFRNI
jgi:hypothetical protein